MRQTRSFEGGVSAQSALREFQRHGQHLPVAFTQTITADGDLFEVVPEDASFLQAEAFVDCLCAQVPSTHEPLKNLKPLALKCLPRFLNRIRRNPLSANQHEATEPPRVAESDNVCQTACFASHGTCGVVDLGASQNVMGNNHLPAFLEQLSPEVRPKVKQGPCQLVFRFGNSATVQSSKALYVPIGRFWLRIALVPGSTPFLLSNSFCRSLQAVIDTDTHEIWFKNLGCKIKMIVSDRNLFLLNIADLVNPPVLKVSNVSQTSACYLTQPVQTEIPFRKEVCFDEVPKLSEVPACITSAGDVPESGKSHSHPSSQQYLKPRQRDFRSTPRPESHERDFGTTLPQAPDRAQGHDHHEGTRADESGGVGRESRGFRENPLWTEVPGRGSERDVLDQMDRRSHGPKRQDDTQGVHLLRPPLHDSRGRDRGDPDRLQGEGRSESDEQGANGASKRQDLLQCTSRVSGPAGSSSPRGCGERSMGDVGGTRRDPVSSGLTDHSGQCRAEPDGPHRNGPGATCGRDDSTTADGMSQDLNVDAMLPTLQVEVEGHLQNNCQDPNFPHDNVLESAHRYEIPSNWVEMELIRTLTRQGFFHQSHQSHQKDRHIDLLELTIGDKAFEARMCAKAGVRCRSLTLTEACLNTWEGRSRIYMFLATHRPSHVWCHCGQQSNLHGRGLEILNLLVAALFRHQMCQGLHCHVYLSWPALAAFETTALDEMRANAYCSWIGCVRDSQLQVYAQVWSSSKILSRDLDVRRSKIDWPTYPQSVAPNELQSRQMHGQILRCVSRSLQRSEEPILVSQEREQGLGNSESNLQQMIKRRRRTYNAYKQTVQAPPLDHDSLAPDRASQCQAILRLIKGQMSRGNTTLTPGEAWDKLQAVFPEVTLHQVEVVRNASRRRRPTQDLAPAEAPWRRTFFLHRSLQEVMIDPTWEAWEDLSRRHLVRPTEPSSVMVTMFGSRVTDAPDQFPEPRTAVRRSVAAFGNLPSTLQTPPLQSPLMQPVEVDPRFAKLTKGQQRCIRT